MELQHQIDALKARIARQRETMQFADGPAYREEKAKLNRLLKELADLEREAAQ